MNKSKKVVCLLVLALLVASMVTFAALAAISHPEVNVVGKVTKDVKLDESIWLYNWEDVDQYLPYALNGSIQVNPWNILFETPFPNETWSVTQGSEDVFEKLIDDNGIPYYHVKQVLSSQSSIREWTSAVATVDIPVTKDTVALIAIKWLGGYQNTPDCEARVEFVLNSAGNTYGIYIGFDLVASSDWEYRDNSGNGFIEVRFKTGENREIFVQIPLEETWYRATGTYIDFDRLTAIHLVCDVRNDTSNTVTDEYVEAAFRYVVISDRKIALNSIVVNHTSTPILVNDSVVLAIYGANATEIKEVTIPFKYNVEPEITCDAENLKMTYRYEVSLPDDDELSFTDTRLYLKSYVDASKYDYLYLTGQDMLPAISSFTAPFEVELTSGLIPGDNHMVDCRIQYTADEYDALTEAPLFWSNPWAWLQYQFWALLTLLASILGIGAAGFRARARGLKVPKMASRWLDG